MSENSKPQEYVIVPSLREANNVPFGYKIVLRSNISALSPDKLEFDVVPDDSSPFFEADSPISVPYITSHSVNYRTLKDGTILADVEFNIDSEALPQNIELRFIEGEKLS